MQVWAVSKLEIEQGNKMSVPHVIISINSPDKKQARPVINDKTIVTLYLCFHDLDAIPGGASFSKVYGEPKVYTMEEAAKVVLLLNEHKPEGVICQCEAGQSRSAGMAAAIAKYYNGEDSQFFSRSSGYNARGYTPNRLVYNRTLEALIEANGLPEWTGS
jgi:hypothetical protein